jgi:hypothetical protein
MEIRKLYPQQTIVYYHRQIFLYRQVVQGNTRHFL